MEKPRKLSEQEELFVIALTTTGGIKASALAAGYAEPSVAGNRLLKRPHVLEALNRALQTRLQGDLLGKSLKVLEFILDSDEINPAIRLAASRYVIDKSIELQQMNSLTDVTKLNPGEMSAEQLEIYIKKSTLIVNNAKESTLIHGDVQDAEHVEELRDQLAQLG